MKTNHTPRRDFVLARLAELYPAPYEVQPEPAGREDAAIRYIALPSLAQARLVVPAAPRRQAALSLQRQLSGDGLRKRAMRSALQAAVASGLLRSGRRNAVTIVGSGRSVTGVLEEVLGARPLLLTMPVGPARANSKAVLQVTGPDGDCLAYVKVGHNDLTRSLVEHEGEVLASIDRSSWFRVVAPERLASINWHGLSLLVMTPLSSSVGQPPDRRQSLIDSVQEIAASSQRKVSSDAETAVDRLRRDLPKCGRLAGRLAAELEPSLRISFRYGAWHGDLHPGNVRLGASAATIWDWERYETGALVGMDLLHHDLMTSITGARQDPLVAASKLLLTAPQVLAPMGESPLQARHTARLYLLTLASRYLRDQQHRAGSELGRVDQWLIPALANDRRTIYEA